MAIRIRKSFKVAPGVRLNVSKSGLSKSIGGKGVTANLSKKGTRLTGSIPRTGLSASKLYPGTKQQRPQSERRSYLWLVVVLVVLFCAMVALRA
ncbi:DUF4236 domain-containing protein [Ectopseudomonas khazarica]|uniref:DUF4236 domain-containing protein n=1 Tax=Ectopseudomonas khazarica TaxID=2502979 RepID=UPI0037CB473B|tara:strand:+ start:84 stop:365 length:282 start_codon:yes stop_codon:yes gene_type:complete